MTLTTQNTLLNRIENVIDLYKDEDMSNAEVMGVLEIAKMNIYQCSEDIEEEEE